MNRFIQMLDTNVPAWVPWEACPTWEQELSSRPTKEKWLPDSKGAVRATSLRRVPDANLSDNYHVSLALQRRGLAAEIAVVMTFEGHEKLRRKLFTALTGDPGDSRYAAPSIERVKDADRRLWHLLAKSCRGGIRPRPGSATLPLDEHIDAVLNSPELAIKLMPLPSAASSSVGAPKRKRTASSESSSSSAAAKSKRRKKSKKGKSKHDELASLRSQVQSLQSSLGNSSKGGGKGSGKGKKGNNQRLTSWAPDRLRPEGVPITPDGRHICFGYNMGECSGAQPGERCERGYHVCSNKRCHKPHSAMSRQCE